MNNKENPTEPELRVLPEGEEPVRLGEEEAVSAGGHKNVEVLQPDVEARLNAKSFEPDVADILDVEEEVVDSEAAWGDAGKKAAPLGWFVLAGLVVCGLGLWAVVSVFKAQPVHKEVEEEKKELSVDILKENKEVRDTLDKMKGCARGYLMAQSVEEKLSYVRHPERIKPMMEGYYQKHEIKQEDFRQFERIRSMGLSSLSFVYCQVKLLDGKKRNLLLEQVDDGSFRVDWESDVCYLPVEWREYVKGEMTESVVMRVYIKRDHFHAYEFRDEKLYESYMLTTRDADDHLFGFVEKGSRVAMDIDRFVKRVEEHGSENPEPLMLRLRFPKDTRSKKCVWIDAMIEPRWTYVKSPEDQE